MDHYNKYLIFSSDIFKIAEVFAFLPFFITFFAIIYDMLRKRGYLTWNPLSHSKEKSKNCWRNCRRKLYDFNGKWIDKILQGDEKNVKIKFPKKEIDIFDDEENSDDAEIFGHGKREDEEE